MSRRACVMKSPSPCVEVPPRLSLVRSPLGPVGSEVLDRIGLTLIKGRAKKSTEPQSAIWAKL